MEMEKWRTIRGLQKRREVSSDCPLLSILIPTVTGRELTLKKLLDNITMEAGACFTDVKYHANIAFTKRWFPYTEIEVLVGCDNKETPIGRKRQLLYTLANGAYAWQVDDDDLIASDAIPLILEAIAREPDCITFEEKVVIDGVEKRSNFSLKYPDWGENQDGFDFVRTPFFKTPIKTQICQQVKVPPIRFGEDHGFARLIQPLLQTEVHIDKQLYYYQHTSSSFTERYGFDKDF